MKISVKKLHPNAMIPKFASHGAACFDLHMLGEEVGSHVDSGARYFTTGLSFEIPAGYVMLIFSRSGHGFRQAMRLSNCVGVIDSDYRGEIKVALRFDGDDNATEFPIIKYGDRIAQAMILPTAGIELVEVDELSKTDRGTGGFGSTGT